MICPNSTTEASERLESRAEVFWVIEDRKGFHPVLRPERQEAHGILWKEIRCWDGETEKDELR